MLVRMYQLLEIVSIVTCLNLLYSKIIRIRLWDIIFILLEMILLEALNYWHFCINIYFVVYSTIPIYLVCKYGLRFRHLMVNTLLCAIIIVLFQLLSSVPTLLLDNYLRSEVLFCFINAAVLIAIVFCGRKERFYQVSLFVLQREWLSKITLIVCTIGVFYLLITYKLSRYLYWDDYVIIGVSFLLIIVLTMQWQKVKAENIMRIREQQIQNTYNDVYRNLIDSIRRKQHDFDNHINAIYSQHLVAKSFEDLVERQKKYCQSVLVDNRFAKLLSAGSSVVAGFLYSKFLEAEERGCEVDFNIRLRDNEYFIPDYCIVEILGILFDNAVEALEKAGKKQVYVVIEGEENGLHILVANESEYISQEEIRRFLKSGFSTKGKERGIGLTNVMELLEKYGAELFVYNRTRKDKNWLVFETRL